MNTHRLPCQQAEILINRFVDKELTANDRQVLESHLGACPACTREFRMAVEMESILLNAPATPLNQGQTSPSREFFEKINLRQSRNSFRKVKRAKPVALEWAALSAAAILCAVLLNSAFPTNANLPSFTAQLPVYKAPARPHQPLLPESLISEGYMTAHREQALNQSDWGVSPNSPLSLPSIDRGEIADTAPSSASGLNTLSPYALSEFTTNQIASLNRTPPQNLEWAELDEHFELPERPTTDPTPEDIPAPRGAPNTFAISRKLELPERPERMERIAFDRNIESPDNGVVTRSARSERPDRPAKRRRAERPERPPKIDRPEKPEREEKPERPDKLDKPERPEQPELPDKPEIEDPEKPELDDLPEVEKPDVKDLERPEIPEDIDRPQKPEKPERPGKAGRPHRGSRE